MSFRGLEHRIPAAEWGLVGSRNTGRQPTGALLRALNLAFDRGVIEREGGSIKLSQAPLPGNPKILAGLDWWPTTSLQRTLIVTSDGKIYRDEGQAGVFAVMMGALNTGMLPVWCEGGSELLGRDRKAFLTTGLDEVQVVEGDAIVTRPINPDTKPIGWEGVVQPRSLFHHNLRLWGILGDQLYGSTTTDHEDFRGIGSIQRAVAPGLGRFLQGAISFKEQCFLWKWPRGLLVLDDSSSDEVEWQTKELTSGIGLAGPNAVAVVDDDVLFVSEIGHLHLLKNIRDGDVQASDLTIANELQDWTRETLAITSDRLARCQIIYYPDRKEAHVALSGMGAAANTRRLVVDFNAVPGQDHDHGPRIRVSDKDVCDSLWVARDSAGIQRPLAGDASGVVWRLDQPAKSIDGTGSYSSEFQTTYDDFSVVSRGFKTRRKNLSFLEVHMQPTGNFDLAIDAYLDGKYAQTLTFNMGGQGTVLGSFLLGTDALGQEFLQLRRRRLRGSCRYISLVGRLSGVNQDFQVQDMVIGFTPGPHTPTRT